MKRTPMMRVQFLLALTQLNVCKWKQDKHAKEDYVCLEPGYEDCIIGKDFGKFVFSTKQNGDIFEDQKTLERLYRCVLLNQK